MSLRSNAMPISPQHHSTFCTLLEVFLPRIFNTVFLRRLSRLGWLEHTDRLAVEKREHVLDGVPVVFRVDFQRAVTEVWRQHRVGSASERMRCRQWLAMENVERCDQPPGLDRVYLRLFIDERRAGRVHQYWSIVQALQFCEGQKTARALA